MPSLPTPTRTYGREDAITRPRLYLIVRKDIIALQQMFAIVKNYQGSMLKIIRFSHFLPIWRLRCSEWSAYGGLSQLPSHRSYKRWPILNARQQRFIEDNLIDENASRAARALGYSSKTAYSIGHRLLRQVEVAEAIAQARQEAARSAGVTLQRIIEEFAKLAFTNLDELVTWQRRQLTLKDSEALTPAQPAALLEVSESESKSGRPLLKVKLYSKRRWNPCCDASRPWTWKSGWRP
jgi:phage terminase small subunit